MRNVSRVWAYETGLAAGVELTPGALVFSNRVCHPRLLFLCRYTYQ
jgi:hypothetical protein